MEVITSVLFPTTSPANTISYCSKHTYNIPENYLDRFTKAKYLFTMYHDKLNPSELNFVKKEQNIKELTNYLVNDCEISSSRVQNAIKKINNVYS